MPQKQHNRLRPQQHSSSSFFFLLPTHSTTPSTPSLLTPHLLHNIIPILPRKRHILRMTPPRHQLILRIHKLDTRVRQRLANCHTPLISIPTPPKPPSSRHLSCLLVDFRTYTYHKQPLPESNPPPCPQNSSTSHSNPYSRPSRTGLSTRRRESLPSRPWKRWCRRGGSKDGSITPERHQKNIPTRRSFGTGARGPVEGGGICVLYAPS